MKVAVFDFCETLVDFQTADEFVRYIIKDVYSQNAGRILRKLKVKTTIVKIAHRLGLMSELNTKEIYLASVCGVDQSDIYRIAQSYYIDRIKPHIIKAAVEELSKYKKLGYRIVVLSGAYKSYIDFFAKDYLVDTIIANEIMFTNGRVNGKLSDDDCIGSVKVKRFNDFRKNITEGIEEIIFFTDSIVDKPFIDYADETVIVSKGGHQKWADLNLYKEIIW